MIEEKKNYPKHQLTIDRRASISMTGVVDVISFDEETIIAETDEGVLVVRGINLHVNKLHLDSGELGVDGEISSLTYDDNAGFGKKPNFFSKLFK
ncbi:MAG: sporulation protein YabP [Clostridiales bacterium]|jgi:sporulation protein YabP|nr:sporulation protein YabP [Clostridiales bacterium]MDR2751557.1 sporulation protein YabP [Clostridiales bacterium]